MKMLEELLIKKTCTLEGEKWNRIKMLHLSFFQNCVKDRMNKCPYMVWKESNECSKEAAWYKIFVTSLRTDQKEPTALVTLFKQTSKTSLWWWYSILPSLSFECQQSCQMRKIKFTLETEKCTGGTGWPTAMATLSLIQVSCSLFYYHHKDN